MKATTQSRVLRALKKGNRVTRKTSIEHGWAENLTATISDLREKGHDIIPVHVSMLDGPDYTRYKLVV
jgi:hypothetical protein|tara:strand:+ start:552 stop:755 length:204 start_codon:yes stop_codon:yes gene_type:complete